LVSALEVRRSTEINNLAWQTSLYDLIEVKGDFAALANRIAAAI